MLKRIVVFAVAAIALAAAPAAAQQYPPTQKSITASDTTPCPGGATTITGQGFEAGTAVTLTLDGSTSLGNPTAGADGAFSIGVTIPSSTATGSHTVTATGTGADTASVTATLNVVSCEETTTTTIVPGVSLPRTGSSSTMPLVRAGLALTALGGVLLAIAAKRRRRAAIAPS
jgi:hypothetical protein